MKQNRITVIENGNIANFDTLRERYIAYLDGTPETVTAYDKGLKRLAGYLFANGIAAPTRETLKQFKDFLRAQGLSSATINLTLAAVRQFFSWTAREGIFPNIADDIKTVRVKTDHRRGFFTAAQMNDVLDTAKGEDLKSLRDYAILRLMATTGIRCIELVRANIGDVETLGTDVVLTIQGKGHSEKDDYVKMPRTVETAIRDYLKARGETDEDAPLFASISNHTTDGGRMTTHSVSRIAKTHFRTAGFDSDRLTAHSLRHTAATINLMYGGNLEETRQLLRHTNINTTLIYQHAIDRISNNSEARIDEALNK